MSFAVTKLDVNSLEVLEAAIATATIMPTQISTRAPRGRILAADFGTNALTLGDMDADYSATGSFSEQQLTFGMFLESDDSRLLGIDAQVGDFAILPPATEHDAQHRGRLMYFAMTLNSERLRDIARVDGIHFDDTLLSKPGFFRPGKAWAKFSSEYAKGLCLSLDEASRIFSTGSEAGGKASKFLVDDMSRLLLNSLVETELAGLEAMPISLLGQKIVRDAQHLIVRGMHHPPDVDQLVAEMDIPRRTLYRAFKAHLGLSPAKYLKLYRLSRAHIELSNATPSNTNVSAIALNWGFLSLGRFSSEYRSVFGVFPRQTLAAEAPTIH